MRRLSDRTRALGELIADFLERAGYQLAEGNHEARLPLWLTMTVGTSKMSAGSGLMKTLGGGSLPRF